MQPLQKRAASPFSGRHRPRGFTLIELAAVVLVLAILAGAVAFSLRDHLQAARLQLLVDRIAAVDQRARVEAQRFDRPVVVRIDADRGRIQRVAGMAASNRRSSPTLAIEGGIVIDQLRTASQRAAQGELRVKFSPLGQTDTYALRLTTPRGRSIWLLVLGTTGQILRLEDNADVEQVFSVQSGTTGPNAG